MQRFRMAGRHIQGELVVVLGLGQLAGLVMAFPLIEQIVNGKTVGGACLTL